MLPKNAFHIVSAIQMLFSSFLVLVFGMLHPCSVPPGLKTLYPLQAFMPPHVTSSVAKFSSQPKAASLLHSSCHRYRNCRFICMCHLITLSAFWGLGSFLSCSPLCPSPHYLAHSGCSVTVEWINYWSIKGQRSWASVTTQNRNFLKMLTLCGLR